MVIWTEAVDTGEQGSTEDSGEQLSDSNLVNGNWNDPLALGVVLLTAQEMGRGHD